VFRKKVFTFIFERYIFFQRYMPSAL